MALKSLRDARRSLAWWSLGLVGLVAMMVAVWPSIRDNPGLNQPALGHVLVLAVIALAAAAVAVVVFERRDLSV